MVESEFSRTHISPNCTTFSGMAEDESWKTATKMQRGNVKRSWTRRRRLSKRSRRAEQKDMITKLKYKGQMRMRVESRWDLKHRKGDQKISE